MKKIANIVNITPFLATIWLIVAGCGNLKTKEQPNYNNDWVYEGIEFDMPRVQEPVFRANSINIADLGAVADGQTLNCHLFAKAIDSLASIGGGKVIVPAGLWLTGPIVMKSNINLHLEDGALVRFSDNFDLYPVVRSAFEGTETYRCQSPISGRDLENIAFTGNGVFDGNGQAWRPVKRFKTTDRQWRALLNSGGVLEDDGSYWWPTEQAARGYIQSNRNNLPRLASREQYLEIKDFLRPVMVSLINCKFILFDGPTFQNSPAWNIHPFLCQHVTIRNINVRNPWYAQNGDGVDIESSRYVLIYNSTFDVGDDAICLKSGRDKEGRDRGVPTEKVIVKNNIVYRGHGGFVIGSEMSGGVRDVHVSGCTFMGTNIGIRFKSARGRGGVVENIFISDINMIDIRNEPIRFNKFYEGRAPSIDDKPETWGPAMPVTEETPVFRNIFMKNIVASGIEQAALFMGLPEMKIENIRLENAVIKAPRGIFMVNAKGIELVNVRIIREQGQALAIFDSEDVKVREFSFNENLDVPALVISGKEIANIKLQKSTFPNLGRDIIMVNDANETAIEWVNN